MFISKKELDTLWRRIQELTYYQDTQVRNQRNLMEKVIALETRLEELIRFILEKKK